MAEMLDRWPLEMTAMVDWGGARYAFCLFLFSVLDLSLCFFFTFFFGSFLSMFFYFCVCVVCVCEWNLCSVRLGVVQEIGVLGFGLGLGLKRGCVSGSKSVLGFDCVWDGLWKFGQIGFRAWMGFGVWTHWVW